MSENMIIIGSGMAGLACGIHARMNGYEVTIFEQHSLPGGLCTSWERGGYTIDGCIHWLVGTKNGTRMRKYLDEVDALAGTEIIDHEVFTQIETGPYADRKTFTVYADADKLRSHMLELASEDEGEIKLFIDRIKKFADFPCGFDRPAELMSPRDYLLLMKTMKPFFADFKDLNGVTIRDFSARFTNPHLREGIAGILGDLRDFPAVALIMMLAWQHAKNGGYPVGGSLALSRRMEKKLIALGGAIHYSSRVADIMVDRGTAVGIRLEDGSEHRADLVVSAADGYTNDLFKMLGGRFTNRRIRKMYAEFPLFQPFFTLSLGINRDFSSESHQAVRILKNPINVENKTQTKLGIKHFCYDPALAPQGKSVLQIMYTSTYEYWAALAGDRGAYREEKAKIAEALIGGLEEFYPGIRKDIEVMDTATPLTFERYTGNRNGTFEGWLLTPRTMNLRIKKTLPGLKNFYMVGQWVQPGGGIPSSIKSARDLVYILCAKNKEAFQAT